MSYLRTPSLVTLLLPIFAFLVVAQNVRVDIGKMPSAIPKECEGVAPASLDGEINIPSLVKEAICKGTGDSLTEFTYIMKATERNKDKKGEVKEQTTTFEVYIPTLKSGTHARGILLATSHNGVPVPEAELLKERTQAGERLENEENKIARQASPQPVNNQSEIKGMHPIGSYARMTMNKGMLGFGRGSARLDIPTVLASCDLKLLRREQIDGRETLVFGFTPQAGVKLDDSVKYISQLKGELWIDKADRIVTKLVGWFDLPGKVNGQTPSAESDAPIFADMIRLQEGVWLPHTTRINAADYPIFFDHMTIDSRLTYSDYKRFVTAAKQEK